MMGGRDERQLCVSTHLWERVPVVKRQRGSAGMPGIPLHCPLCQDGAEGAQQPMHHCGQKPREEQPEECCIGISSVPAWSRAGFIGKTDDFGRCIAFVRCLALLSGPGLRGKGKEHHDCKTTGFIPFLSWSSCGQRTELCSERLRYGRKSPQGLQKHSRARCKNL